MFYKPVIVFVLNFFHIFVLGNGRLVLQSTSANTEFGTNNGDIKFDGLDPRRYISSLQPLASEYLKIHFYK